MKKIILFLNLFALLGSTGFSQGNPEEKYDSDSSDSPKAIMETMPEFPGGEVAMAKFIEKNLKYPPLAIENNIQGRVLVEFIIDENGKVTNARVVSKPLGWGIEGAALKVINSMPDWKPGTQDGKLVKVRFVVPIRFKLSDPKPKKKSKRRN